MSKMAIAKQVHCQRMFPWDVCRAPRGFALAVEMLDIRSGNPVEGYGGRQCRVGAARTFMEGRAPLRPPQSHAGTRQETEGLLVSLSVF